MSTNPRNLDSLWPDDSFATIDDGIAEFSRANLAEAKAAVTVTGDRTQRLLAAWTAVRPIIVVLTAVPLLPPVWRMAIRVFVASLDEISTEVPEAGEPDFKAGKDL